MANASAARAKSEQTVPLLTRSCCSSKEAAQRDRHDLEIAQLLLLASMCYMSSSAKFSHWKGEIFSSAHVLCLLSTLSGPWHSYAATRHDSCVQSEVADIKPWDFWWNFTSLCGFKDYLFQFLLSHQLRQDKPAAQGCKGLWNIPFICSLDGNHMEN